MMHALPQALQRQQNRKGEQKKRKNAPNSRKGKPCPPKNHRERS
jgi:hypothetical protein